MENLNSADPLGRLPDEFFENQLGSILRKTVTIEAHRFAGSKDADTLFPVPNGYWLQMEEGIRNKVSAPPAKVILLGKPVLQWAMSLGLLLGVGVWLYVANPFKETIPQNWEAQLDVIPESELLAFVESENVATPQWMQTAVQLVSDDDIQLPSPPISDQEIETSLDELTDQDLDTDYIIN